MRIGTILHNPGAGDEGHESEELKNLLERNGFDCHYLSVKSSSWQSFGFETDFIVAAGGDGTIRTVLKALLGRKMIARTWPVALLPLGTANNISKTINHETEKEKVVAAWRKWQTKRIDIGCLHYGKEDDFFIESFGYGLFPMLMKQAKKELKQQEFETPQHEIKAAQELMYRIVTEYEPTQCTLMVDDVDHSGKYLMMEMMNTRSIGPNLELVPNADPGDGMMEVVLVPEQDKDKFLAYIRCKIEGADDVYHFQKIKGRKMVVSWAGTHVHVDDELLELDKNQQVIIETRPGLLEFLVA